MRSSGLAALVAVSTVLALAACDRGAEEARTPAPATPAVVIPQGFQHEPGFDAQGFYRTETPVQSGDYRLNLLAIGAPSDFQSWESGARDGVFGPIWMLFDDVTTPATADNEVGEGGHAVTVRLLPQSYSLSPGRVTFRGKDARLGDVTLDGVFDTAALAQARTAGTSEGRPVVSGSLQIGEARLANVGFGYWAGD